METVIRNAAIVNEGRVTETDILIRNERFEKIGNVPDSPGRRNEIDAKGMMVIPGVIDDQVHFREPGLTHKGDILSESRAAVAGGITSFMEMPNTVPQTTTQKLLEEKYNLGARQAMANYSFFMGVTNSNTDEVLRTSTEDVCGIKIFMGSSTGDMLVDNSRVLETIFGNTPTLVAVHCESEEIIKANADKARLEYGDSVPPRMHPVIRDAEACYQSSSKAINLAQRFGTRLHVLHISTARETELFSNKAESATKRITAEACIHHLWFSDEDYEEKGNWIKWNPAIKSKDDREAIRKAVIDGRIDIIATDHAPHTKEEKQQGYWYSPSGGPLVQHALPAMMELVQQGVISITKVVEKICHAPADIFRIIDRGYIREGYYADLAFLRMNHPWRVTEQNILYKCGWSPFLETVFHAEVESTFINGTRVYHNGEFDEQFRGQRLKFKTDRH